LNETPGRVRVTTKRRRRVGSLTELGHTQIRTLKTTRRASPTVSLDTIGRRLR